MSLVILVLFAQLAALDMNNCIILEKTGANTWQCMEQESIVKRDPEQARLFREANPCPSTGKTTEACPNWIIDHIVPLCFGGADNPANMQWQGQRESYIKDVFERQACALKKECSKP